MPARLDSLADLLTPPSLAHQPDVATRARAWSSACLLAGAISAGFAAVPSTTSIDLAAIADGVGALCFVVAAVYLQMTGDLNRSVHFASGSAAALLLKSAILSGPLSIATIAWYSLLPLIATVGLGRRLGLAWTCVVLPLPFLLSTLGIARELNEEPQIALSITILLGSLSVMMWTYEIWGEQVREERDDAIAALADAQQTTDDIIDARNQFVKNVSHEFRTPLNHILGATQLLGETELDEEQRDLVHIAETSGEELLTIVDGAITMQDLAQGQFALKQEWIDPHVLISRLDRDFTAKARSKQIELAVDIDPQLPSRMYGDPNRIEQILKNLLNNAISFTESGTVRLQVSYLDDDVVRFEVEDSGIGIPETELEHIFLPFFQVDSSDSRSHGGLGAGLALSRELARLMGGDITARSHEGLGSIFTFEAVLKEDANHNYTPVSPTPYRRTFRSARVVLAEANPRTREGFLGMLGRMGLQADGVADQTQLLAMVGRRPIDIVFVDMDLPGIHSGRDLLKKLREYARQKDATYIALMRSDSSLSIQGFSDSFPKPLRQEQVITVIRKWVGQSAHQVAY